MASIPAFLVQALQAQYGEELTGEILQGYACRRPVTLRVNTLKAAPEEIRARLTQAGLEWEDVAWSPEALILPGCREEAVQALPMYQQGEIYLQSLSSMLPPLFLRPGAGESILDMAAAPGGKTTQMAALSAGKAMITACEKNAIRAQRLQFNLQRQGAGRVSVLVQDARRLDDFFSFDKILLDAPCSGSGTLILEGADETVEHPISAAEPVEITDLTLAMTSKRDGDERISAVVLRTTTDDVIEGFSAEYTYTTS